MKSLSFTLCFIYLFFYSTHLQANTPVWSNAYSAGTVAYDLGRTVAFDSDGNYYLLGQANTSPDNYLTDMDFGNGVSFTIDDSGFHCFVVKFNANNEAQWVKKFIVNGGNGVIDLVIDNYNNIFVLGTFQWTAVFDNVTLTGLGMSTFLAKFSSSGSFQWVTNTTSPTHKKAACKDLETDGSNLYITGYFKETQHFGGKTITSAGDDNIFIAKVSNSGTVLFFKQEGGSENAWGEALAFQGDDLYLTGWYKGTTSIAGTSLNSNGRADYFLAKYDFNGNPSWVRDAGGAFTSDYGKGVIVDEVTGDVYVSGRFGGTMNMGAVTLTSTAGLDLFLAKYNSAGTIQWAKQSTGTGTTLAGNLVFDGVGDIVIYGANLGEITIGNASLNPGSWLKFFARFDLAGNFVCIDQLNEPGQINEVSDKISSDGNGTVFKTGAFSGSILFGGTTLNSLGSGDLYIAQQNFSPLPVELKSFQARLSGKDVILKWNTDSELNNHGFVIEQSFDAQNFEEIDFVEGKGTSQQPQQYFFIHDNVAEESYARFAYYRLRQIDFDGAYTYSSIEVVDLGVLLDDFKITRIKNDYIQNQQIKIFYSNPAKIKKMRLILCDIQGRVIRKTSLVSTEQSNYIELDLPENLSGLFFLSIETGKEVISKSFYLNLF